MAKQKLSGVRREKILARIEERVRSINCSDLVEVAEETAMAVKLRADEIYFKAFPPADMATLEKYNSTDNVWDLRVVANNTDDDLPAKHDDFQMTEARPVPKNSQGRRAIIRRDDVIFDLERKATSAAEELEARVKLIMGDYRAVVINSNYFEDLVALIPEVGKFENEIYPASGALSVLTRDVVDRVRQDQERLAA